MATLQILVVDDDPGPLETLEFLLQHDGHHPMTADNVEKAMMILNDLRQPLELLITDRNMPRMLGEALIRHAKRARPTLKAILISGLLDKFIEEAVMAAGADWILPKPTSLADFRSVIKELFPDG